MARSSKSPCWQTQRATTRQARHQQSRHRGKTRCHARGNSCNKGSSPDNLPSGYPSPHVQVTGQYSLGLNSESPSYDQHPPRTRGVRGARVVGWGGGRLGGLAGHGADLPAPSGQAPRIQPLSAACRFVRTQVCLPASQILHPARNPARRLLTWSVGSDFRKSWSVSCLHTPLLPDDETHGAGLLPFCTRA